MYLVEHDIGKKGIKNYRRSFSMLITMAQSPGLVKCDYTR